MDITKSCLAIETQGNDRITLTTYLLSPLENNQTCKVGTPSEKLCSLFPPNPPQAIPQCVGVQGKQHGGSTELTGAVGKDPAGSSRHRARLSSPAAELQKH